MTLKQKKAIENLVGNGGNVTAAMREAGYAEATVNTPGKLTKSKTWKELMGEFLPDQDLAQVHRGLLNSHRIDHMVFPLGPADEEEADILAEEGIEGSAQERTTLTDAEITELLATVNCTVRKIVHGRTARHVYFWSPDAKAKTSALDMAYKLKGKYAAEKIPPATGDNLTDGERHVLESLIAGRSIRDAEIVTDVPAVEIQDPLKTIVEPDILPEAPKIPETLDTAALEDLLK